tara:strand:- start:186 stop:2165 length:1980 start_codon:yes stop_codon:yes gene_type:complete
MAENVQQTVYQREAPEIEAYKVARMQDALRYVQELQRQGITPPAQTIAGLTSEQQAAGDLIRSGVGSYAPFLQGGLDANQAAQGMISDTAMPFIQESYGQQLEGIADLGQARDLALGQMQDAYQYRDAAMQGFSDASAGIGQAREGVGGQVSAAQQGIGRADQLGQQAAQFGQQGLTDAARSSMPASRRAQTEAIRSGRQAGRISGQGRQGIQDAAGGIAGQISGAQQGLGQATRRARREVGGAQQDLARAGAMGRSTARRGIAQLAGSADQFDPSGIGAFMDPFTRDVIEAEQAEIARLGEKQKMDARAQQAKAGAFGGSRGAIAEAEIGRNVLEQQARTGAQLSSQGYQQAAQQAQQAFEAAKGRQQQGAQLTGQLGQAGAATGLQAASQAGQLGLSAEQLAQRGAGQAGQLGLQGQMSQAQLAENAAKLGISTEQLQAQLAAQGAQTAQNQAKLGMDAAGQGAQLGMGAAQLGQRGAIAGGQLGLSGQEAMAQMSGQQANVAQLGGQMGLQYGQLGQANVAQLADLAQQRGAMGQGIAGLANQTGALAGQLGSLGGQQVQMGAQGQAMRGQDINQLMQFGGMNQQQAQNVLNAQFAADQAAYQAPFQQMAFLTDTASGLPSSQYSITQQQSSSPGFAQTAAGLGMGVAGLNRAGVI